MFFNPRITSIIQNDSGGGRVGSQAEYVGTSRAPILVVHAPCCPPCLVKGYALIGQGDLQLFAFCHGGQCRCQEHGEELGAIAREAYTLHRRSVW